MAYSIPGFSYPEGHRHGPLPRRIVKVAENVYAFVGFGISVFSIILGADGYILVDAGSGEDYAEDGLKEIARLTSLPLAAVIFTHNHADHTGGIGVFLEGRPANIPIWARANFGAEIAGAEGIEKISALRAGLQFGVSLAPEQMRENFMVPVNPAAGRKPRQAAVPNHTFSEDMRLLSIAGVELELHASPGETMDHLFIRLPVSSVIFTGDTAYRSFPNLAPIRGGTYRDVRLWADSVRKIRSFSPRAIVMGHNEPAFGEEALELLSDYGDAIMYVYNATVQGMNAGLGPDELAAAIRLPAHLREKPWLGEFYGCVQWAVRSIFCGLLGWFDGNPANIMPLSPREEAERTAALAGGEEALLAAAKAACEQKDWRWAAKLADYMLRLSPESAVAREIKADALYALSDLILPIGGYNYLRACALELRRG